MDDGGEQRGATKQKTRVLATIGAATAPIANAIGYSSMLGEVVRWRDFFASVIETYQELTSCIFAVLPFSLSRTAIDILIIYLGLVAGARVSLYLTNKEKADPWKVVPADPDKPGENGRRAAERMFANPVSRFFVVLLLPAVLPFILFFAAILVAVMEVVLKRNGKAAIAELFSTLWMMAKTLLGTYVRFAAYGLLTFLVMLMFFAEWTAIS